MKINRRAFISLVFATPLQTTQLSVAVLEVFESGQGVMAVLVRHAAAVERDRFANWLRSHPKSAVRVRTTSGADAPGTLFRVRMCFGRGLIIFQTRMNVRERDVLSVTAGAGGY